MKEELLLLALRCCGVLATSFAISALSLWAYLRLFATRFQQPIRSLGPKSHQAKKGTPTGGGVFIVLAIVVSSLLWAGEGALWLVAGTLLFGLIGLMDDLSKLFGSRGRSEGESHGFGMRLKLVLQFSAAFLVLGALYYLAGVDDGLRDVFVPLLGDTAPWPLWLWLGGSAIFLVFICNAVNLTDGVDGLVSIPVVLVALGLGLLALLTDPLSGRAIVAGAPVLSTDVNLLFAMAIIGAVLAFLWFNAPPARLFMGDTGALALGGALAMMAIVLNQPFMMLLMGGVFVLEGLSVLAQIGWFKWSGGKRIFRMAPYHHHLEALGWTEMQISVRFWLATVLLLGLSLSLALYTLYREIH